MNPGQWKEECIQLAKECFRLSGENAKNGKGKLKDLFQKVIEKNPGMGRAAYVIYNDDLALSYFYWGTGGPPPAEVVEADAAEKRRLELEKALAKKREAEAKARADAKKRRVEEAHKKKLLQMRAK